MKKITSYLLQIGFFVVSIPLIYILLNSAWVQNFLHQHAAQ